MFFTPVIRRAAYNHPRSADLALQRFLQGSLNAAHAAADVNVTRDDKATTLQLDVPGLAREQIEIKIDGKQVRLSSVEGAPRRLSRAWELADEIDAAASSARLENGVLTLTLARVAPVDRTATLAIQ